MNIADAMKTKVFEAPGPGQKETQVFHSYGGEHRSFLQDRYGIK